MRSFLNFITRMDISNTNRRLSPATKGQLRLTSLIEQIGRTDYDDWRNELIRRLARSTWQQHPTAISIRGFFGSVTPPTLNAYRSGKNERRFTCQYVYDFEHPLRKEKLELP